MTRAGLMKILGPEGLTKHKLVWAVATRRVDRPVEDGAGNFQYDAHHVEQLREYLSTVRRGRKPAREGVLIG